jgi:dsDNA-specific endonuclease/ATPase MutS2
LPARQAGGPTPPAGGGSGAAGTGGGIAYTLQTSTNSVDLRGKDAASAIEAAWNFIDRALLRGEPAVVLIHGHGEGTLKAAVRDALRSNCPYDVRFRAGLDQEGGDGVTIVALK